MTSKAQRQAQRLEELWALEDRLAEQRSRRKNCVERVAYHAYLADVFRGHVARHEREQERYRSILAEDTEEA